MTIAAWGNATGSKTWRLGDPAKYLNKLGFQIKVFEDAGITEEIAKESDVFVLSSCIDKDGIALLYEYQQDHGKKLVVDCDDFYELNPDSPFTMEHQISDAPEVIKRTMEVADVITTTTNYLADKLRVINPNVVVLPNFMDLERWDVDKIHNTSDTIRIGWAGSVTHLNDLKMIAPVLKRICAEFPQVRLIFIGEQRIADELEGCPVECMLGVPFDVWPTRLNGLQLDIGLAPLLDTPFNRCKSNIKWLEYSIAQVPGVYSPTVYQHRGFEPKFGLVATTEEEWYGAIKHLILNPNRRRDIAESAYRLVKTNYSLEKHINKWGEAYQNLFL